MHQDATWYGGRPRPRPHCARWGPSSPSPEGAQPQFSANVRCRQTAGWTKMSVGTEVGLGPGDCVRWGLSYPQKKGHSRHRILGPLWPNGWMDQDASWYGGKSRPRRRYVRWDRSWHSPQFLAHVYCGRTAGWMKTPLGTEVDLGPGPRSPISATAELLLMLQSTLFT